MSRPAHLTGSRCDRPARPPAGALILVCTTASLLLPGSASAQHEAFVRGAVELTRALAGTYGDEGPAVLESLEAMERGLAAWDGRLQEYEGNVAAALPAASPQRALSMHATMGALYVARGRLDAAIREYDAAVRLAPQASRLQLFRGLVHESAGRDAEALEAYRAARELAPEDPVAAYLVASRSLRSPSWPHPREALATLSAAVDHMIAGEGAAVPPEPFIDTTLLADTATETPLFVPARYLDAYALFERARYPEAVAALRGAVQDDPLVSDARSEAFRQASSALREGRVADAIGHAREAVAEAPESAETHRLLGVGYWAAAEYDRSIGALEAAMAVSPSDERVRLTLARVFEEIGQTERARALLEETVRLLPSSSLAHWRLGRLYAAANRTEDALQEFQRAAGPGMLTGEGPLFTEIGALHRQRVDPERAVEAFSRAVAFRPNDAIAHRELGRSLLQANHEDAAFVELAAALLLDPRDPEASLSLGQMHLDGGRYADAARMLAYTVGIDGAHAEARYALANALVRSDRREDAAVHLQAFQNLQAEAREMQRRRIEVSVLKLEAAVRAEEGDGARAAALWEQAIAAEPDQASSHAGLAAALATLGRHDAAVNAYERALTLGAAPSVYRELAALHERMGRPDEAARTRARLARAQQDAFTLTSPVQ